MKYNFYQLRKIPRNKPLPEDVNEYIEEIGGKLGGENVLSALKKMREKRMYGKVTHYAPTANGNYANGEFYFQDGMCTRIELVSIENDSVTINRSVHNPSLSMSKDLKGTEHYETA